MEYIERYLYRVEKMLPKEEKKDVIEELRELLEEEVKALQGNNISPKDLEENQLKVLKNFGSPELIASKYGGGIKPLIPAELMPSFVTVLKVLAVVYTILFIGLGIISKPFSLGFFSSFVSNAISNFGILVIIFYLIGRSGEKLEVGSDWSPKNLKPIPGKEKAKQFDLIIGIAFNSFFLILINLFPEYLGVGFNENGDWRWVPFNLNFLEPFTPLISIGLIGRIFIDVYVLQKEAWSKGIMIADIILNAAGLALIGYIYSLGVEVEFAESVPSLERLYPLFLRLTDFVFGIVGVAFVINIVKRLISLIRYYYITT